MITILSSSPHYVGASGSLKNFNTIEDFKSADKSALFNQISDQVREQTPSSYQANFLKIWEGITKKDTSLLNHFFLITYADLKKYKYYYWFAFPAFVSKPAWEIGDAGLATADTALGAEMARFITRIYHLANG